MSTPEVDCNELLGELQRFVDGEIPPERVEAMTDHLAHCYPCAERADFERELKLLIRRRCEDEKAPASLLDRIRSCLDDVDLASES